MSAHTVEQSRAFIERFSLPPTADGPLAGLTFAVKDIIDVAGRPTGCGNPTWLATHPPALFSAVCVEQLLAAGARCEGKTITDEVAGSLIGENVHYGTPLNPAAPDRVPGGSSSGSASAVACGLVDFALGTDTGGSVRIPASNCGIWGLRPSHGIISVAGVMPFAPTYDTVGLFARDVNKLQRAASILLGTEATDNAPPQPRTIHLITETFALADAEVRDALERPVARLKELWGDRIRETSLAELCDDTEAADLTNWHDCYRVLQRAEVGSTLGAWIADAKPTFGPGMAASFKLVLAFDRTHVGPIAARRERFARGLRRALGEHDLLCMPTAPTAAPLITAISHARDGDYYGRTLALTAIAGVARLPQISMPLATMPTAPIGLSLLAVYGNDAFLLHAANTVERHSYRRAK